MKLKLVKCKSINNWFTIERAEHDNRTWVEQLSPNSSAFRYSGRISDADVEGTLEEMKEIAKAIRARGFAHFKRCMVVVNGNDVLFESPRNSSAPGITTLEEADDLATQIEQYIP
jgi:hypothetical protein